MKFLKDALEFDLGENLFVFPGDEDQDRVKDPSDDRYLQVYPYALSWVADPTRPLLLFQNDDKSLTLPVAVSSLGAAVILAQNSPHLPETNPFAPMVAMAEALDASFKECVFTEVKGHYQYAKLVLKSGEKLKELHLRADDLVTAALSFKIPFFTTTKFIKSSRVMSSNMEALQKNPQMQLQIINRPGTYLM